MQFPPPSNPMPVPPPLRTLDDKPVPQSKHRKSLAIKYLFTKLTGRCSNSYVVKAEMDKIDQTKPKMKVIMRNGVEVFITVDNRQQWHDNRNRLINYAEPQGI